MGNTGYQAQLLQPLPKQHWELLSCNTPKSTPRLYGSYRIYQNIFTQQQVQQYGVLFESNQQYEDYLTSFCQRRNEQNIVNTRYINLEKCMGVCGCGKYARVFVERIPIRLNQITKIQQEEIVYVMGSMLQGFQKLYKRYLYFRVRPEMVGIDRDGRVKVWINPNYSKNEHYFPAELNKVYLNKIEQINSIQEDKMVSEIVDMLHSNTSSPSHQIPALVNLLKKHQGHLSFKLAGQLIKSYAQQNRIEQKNYFESILSQIHQKINFSSDDLPSVSCCSIDGKSFSPIITKHKIIYYINPQDHSDSFFSSQYGSQSSRKVRKPFLQNNLAGSIVSNKSLVSDPGSIRQHFAINRTLTPSPNGNYFGQSQQNKPKIQFNYNKNQTNMIPKYFNDPNMTPFQKKNTQAFSLDIATPHPNLEKSSSSRSEMNSNPNNFMFSGLNEDYVLDKELLEDMEIILSQQQSF